MRLAMQETAGWSVAEVRANVWCATADGERSVTVTYGPLVPATIDAHAWAKRVLAEDVPAGARLDVTVDRRTETREGWPVALIDSAVCGPDGAVLEARRTALYSLLQHAAVAVARAPSRELLDRHAESIERLLLAATPRWEAGTCTIDALLEGTTEPGAAM